VDPTWAVTVRRIFELAGEGRSVRAIAAAVSDERRSWSPRTVHDILRNPVYAGRMVRYRRGAKDRYYRPDGVEGRAELGQVPAIIEEALWAGAQAGRRAA
ncbi:MAG TPA: recombinase family protein, partial [Candidatus Limnocylindrales bacterium]